MKRRAPAPYVIAPNAVQIADNMMLLRDGRILAGYRIGPQRWDYTSDDAKINRIQSAADVYGALGGRFFHERVTTRPHPVRDWAAALDRRTPHPLPPPEDCDETWNRHLARQQARIANTGMDDKLVFRYFGIGRVRGKADLYDGTNEQIVAAWAEQKRVADIVTGWNARPMTAREQAWLRVRTMAPGVQPELGEHAKDWGAAELPALANDIRWHEEPFDRTVGIHAWHRGVRQDRAVQILTVSRMDDLQYPGGGLEPWQTYAERAMDTMSRPFSVEWSIVGNLRTGDELKAGAELDLRKALYLEKDYRQHQEPPPAGIEKGIAVAKSTRDQVTEGNATLAGRFEGTINVIISGDAEYVGDRMTKSAADVVEERAAAFVRLYSGNDLRMEFTPTRPQSAKLIETIVGEPYEIRGYQQQVRYDYLSAGLPSVSTAVGDGAGPYLGYTRGAARRPFLHDPWYATEGRGALGRGNNMWLIAGALGAGKTMLAGAIFYQAARRNARCIFSDPSGPMAKLCSLPEFRDAAQVIDLLQGQDGILNVPSLIREPWITEYETQAEWAEACDRAKAERRDLVVDTARRCLDSDLYAEARTISTLRAAARRVSWGPHRSLWDLVAALREEHEQHADNVALALEDAASAPVLRLLFPPRGGIGVPQQFSVMDKRITVICTPGITRAPDGVAREDWTDKEKAADAILRLVALFTDRLIYTKPRDERCIVFFDEAESLTDFGPGRGFLSRLGRDHSKWNTPVYLCVKSINEQMLSGELRNFLAGAFVGRMANIDTAEKMLNVLNVEDRSYARSLMNLSAVAPGEFVHLDADGQIGSVRIDLDYYPPLKKALLTNPMPEGVDGWNAEVTV
jgi:hypothetical protein